MARSFGARLGSRLRARREAAGLSQAALAERAGVSPNYVSVLERGQKIPTVDTLVRLARGVGTSPGELLGDVRVDDEWIDEMMDVVRRVPRAQRRTALAVLRAVASVRPDPRTK